MRTFVLFAITSAEGVQAVFIPAVAAFLAQESIFGLSRRLGLNYEPGQEAQVGWSFRFTLRIIAFVLFLVYFAVLAVGPSRAWSWYSATVNLPHPEIFAGLSAVAITAWSGSLIAFVVRKRLTVTLSQGLRFMIYACFTPLVALTQSGFLIRTLAFGMAIGLSALAAFQVWIASHNLTLSVQMKAASSPEETKATQDALAGIPAEVAVRFDEHMSEAGNYLLDGATDFLFGWKSSGLLCVLAIVVLAFTNDRVIFLCSVVALWVGLNLAFTALVRPSVPTVEDA